MSTVLDEAEAVLLSEKLRFPADFFAAEPKARVEVRSLLFRPTNAMTKAERVYRAELVSAIAELIMVATRSRPLPPVRIPTRRNNRGVAEMAVQMRERLNLDEGAPIESLTEAAERCGVVVVVARQFDGVDDAPAGSIREQHRGVSAWVGQFNEQPVMVLPAMESWERTRWAVAHELGHISLHGTGRVDEVAEVEAAVFASELLAPIEHIRGEVDAAVTLSRLVEVKMKWGISIGALIMHLGRNRVISQQRVRSLQAQMYTRINPGTGRSWGMAEPGWDDRSPERPQVLSTWLKETLGASTPAQLAALADVVLPADVLADILGGGG